MWSKHDVVNQMLVDQRHNSRQGIVSRPAVADAERIRLSLGVSINGTHAELGRRRSINAGYKDRHGRYRAVTARRRTQLDSDKL
jgi:hypothetical protein